MQKIATFLILTALIASCGGDKSILDEKLYDGPVIIMDTIVTRFSDDGIVRFVLKAVKEEKFENGDQMWPDGLLLEIYDQETRALKTTFEADSVFYNKKENIYRGEGNVKVVNLNTNERLNTEQLFWNQSEEIFYTERFVTIFDEDNLPTYGEGLTANQDFSEYEILRALGEKDLGQGF
ncbi:MAG: LPS export ABC transporter periplasmic protein LptC [Cyclobacteriaceae bacterium]